MALIKCPECGQMISEYADKCISCGCPMDKIKSLLTEQNKKEQSETTTPNKVMFFEKITKQEQDFIDLFRKTITNLYPNTFVFSNTEYYFGIKIKGTPKYPFTFKKPSANLLFRYPGDKEEEFLTQAVLSFDMDGVRELIAIIQRKVTWLPLVNRENISEPVVEEETKYFDTLSEEEQNFIKLFRGRIRRLYRGVLSFRGHKSFYGLRYKDESGYSFMFKTINGDFVFRYKNENGRRESYIINSLTIENVDAIVGIVNRIVKGDEAVTNTSQTVVPALTNEEIKFVEIFQKIIEEHYKNTFDVLINNNHCPSFRNKSSGTIIFWIVKEQTGLVFNYRLYNANDEKTFKITQPGKDQLLKIINFSKQSADSFNIISDYDKVPNQQPQQETKHELRIFSFIKDEMRGQYYEATPSEKALCRNIRAYYLSVMRLQSIGEVAIEDVNIPFVKNDSAHISYSANFFGKTLFWGENRGIESAKILYAYFKANTIAAKIKDYEDIFKKTIIVDYSSFIKSLGEAILKGGEVNYDASNGLTSDFALVPKSALDDILENFKAYEIN